MEPLIGELRIFGGNFAPVGWFACDGSLKSIAQYETLYALLGTTYGGDGITTFAVPDLRGRVVVNQGTSARSGTNYGLGQASGMEAITLNVGQMGMHSHSFLASKHDGNTVNVTNNFIASPVAPPNPPSSNKNIVFYQPDTPTEVKAAFKPDSIVPTGNNFPHDNMQPYITITYIIAWQGVYPSFG